MCGVECVCGIVFDFFNVANLQTLDDCYMLCYIKFL